jgi:hypothetical protein
MKSDRELMQMAMETIQGCRPSSKSYKQMREAVEALRDRLAQPKSDCKPDFDLIFEANSADIEALTDAQFTLEAIKSADPGTYDEIITRSLNLIKVALNNSVVGPLEVIADKMGVQT